ncbi:G2/mitotic-specific cyclin CLB2 [Candida viswanathii]|uniref:G2/mitotic-specific cyclin CLB2 n=1 Tax=Candida viswanathii TaxID=5486 RepID=A0A367YQF4_9ASCO|nr:G2/mitotic-specific cyclin CLB2 [Candida viswanathii]
MPQTVQSNNENDFRLTRSKVHHQQSITTTTTQLSKTTISTTTSANIDSTNSSSQSSSHSNETHEQSQHTTRQYLADVSNQYVTRQLLPNNTTTNKRKPLGGDNAPLQQQSKLARPIPIASDNKLASLTVPSRLPQKRQATESSTNLVEKLRIPESAAENTESYHKKSRLIDYEWQDLDEEDIDDPLMASEYVNDIFSYFYELETRMLPDPQYLFQKDSHLKPRMRSILVDWLVEMHLKFRLLPESLFLAINIMDRFMSIEVVQIDRLQLLATGSLFIAAKYEEVFSPLVKNYAYFTDGSYTEEEILQAEKYILTILNFDLNYPNPMNFLRRISKADDYDVQSRTLGKYLLEITIVDYKFIGMRPSLCCALAMYLARLILGKVPIWNGNLIHYSGGYRISDMKQCIELMFEYLLAPIEHDEFFKKYAMRKFMKASSLCRSWAKKFEAEGKDLFDASLSTHRLTLEDEELL